MEKKIILVMNISTIISALEQFAHPSLQESYDNAGLITGNPGWTCTGVLVSLDATELIIEEAIQRKCNLVVAHHPIIFKGLKKITGSNYVEQTIIRAIKHDIAIYAIHTNLDNVLGGVSSKMADMLGLKNQQILQPVTGGLQKLAVFVPITHKEKLLNALFEAGAGQIGNYDECSFSSPGSGSFRAGENTNPFTGEKGKRHIEEEVKVEVILPGWMSKKLLDAMTAAHPYEEVAYDLYPLDNAWKNTGSGIIGDLPVAMEGQELLQLLQQVFTLQTIRHTAIPGKKLQKLAVCGGAGSFLISRAKAAGADVYVTADLKYHEFFDAEGQLLLADIGHYESEQFTIELLFDFLSEKFPNFAVLKTGLISNPVLYFTAKP